MYAKKKLHIDMKEARRRLRYDAETGEFTWLFSQNKHSGAKAGFQKEDRYIRIKFMGKEYMASNLAWAFVHGEIPAMEIDHINRDRADNRIANLRLVTRAQNMANTKSRANDDVLGATYISKVGKWQAQIQISRQALYLGLYDTAEAASAAYWAARSRAIEAARAQVQP